MRTNFLVLPLGFSAYLCGGSGLDGDDYAMNYYSISKFYLFDKLFPISPIFGCFLGRFGP